VLNKSTHQSSRPNTLPSRPVKLTAEPQLSNNKYDAPMISLTRDQQPYGAVVVVVVDAYRRDKVPYLDPSRRSDVTTLATTLVLELEFLSFDHVCAPQRSA
jgi:hypothetical protein